MSGYPISRYSIAPHGRQSSLSNPAALGASQPSPALAARINEKKQELENLMALRDLSANLATQMQQLEDKLKTLADGTEGKSSQHGATKCIEGIG
jgi:DASH complex subunit DAD2